MKEKIDNFYRVSTRQSSLYTSVAFLVNFDRRL